MAETNPPGFLQNRADHPASELRGYIAPLITSAGIISTGDWAVSQRGAGANMSVDVAGGQGYILGTENASQHYYHCLSDTTVINKVVAAAHATLNRTDIVIARVYDAQYSGATNVWAIEVITGTPGAGTPAAPATPANSLVLATLYIAAAVTSVLTANITDTRVLVAVPVSAETHAASAKSTPVDADEFPIVDSAASFGLKKITWAQIKLAIQVWLNTITNIFITSPSEFTNIVGAAPTATNNIDSLTSQDWLFTTNATNNFAPNFRGDGTHSLDGQMSVGMTKSFTLRVTQGGTAYYITAITIDGGAQTVKWATGVAPTAGNASSQDVYTFAITKTAAATFTVLGSLTKFA